MATLQALYNNIKTLITKYFEEKTIEDKRLPQWVELYFNYNQGELNVGGVTSTEPLIFTFTGTELTQYSSGSFSGTDMFIDYGDGTIETTTGKFGHIYEESGIYKVKIYGVTSLGTSCFNGCTGLTSITIPSNVTSLGNSCFNGCTGLTSITISNNVTSLGTYCFNGCTSLAHIYFNWTSTDILTYNNTWINGAYANLIFNVPNNTKSAYVSKGYPSEKLLEAGD